MAHRNRGKVIWLAVIIFGLGHSSEGLAAVRYWSGTVPGPVVGGSGVWNTSSANWSTDAISGNYTLWNNSAGDTAWLANSGGVVTLSEEISLSSLVVRSNGYSLQGQAISFVGTGNGTRTIDVGTSSSTILTLNNEIKGLLGWIKTGSGQLTLNSASSYSGDAGLDQGQVNVGHNEAFSDGLVWLNGASLSAVGAARNLSNQFVLGANTSVVGSLPLTLSGGVTLNGNRQLTIASSGLTTLAGGLSETGGVRSFTKAGNGNLLLTGVSTYTGTTTISAGVLALSGSGSISAGNLVLSGGVLAASGVFDRGLGTGAGQFRFTSNGGFAAFGGPLSITGISGNPVWGSTPGFLADNRVLTLGATLANSTVTWTNEFSLGGANRTITVTGNLTTAPAVITGVISSASGGGIIRNGNGRLDLLGLNTYSGATFLQSGLTIIDTLKDVGGGASSLGAPTTAVNGTIRLGSGTSTATLRYLGAGATSDRLLHLAGTTGGGILESSGPGAWVLSGGVTAASGGNKTLTLGGTNLGANTLSGVVADHSASSRTSLTKTGVGRWVISGQNTHSGNTTLSSGILVVGSDQAFGSGTLLLAGSGAILEATNSPRSVGVPVILRANTNLEGNASLSFLNTFTQVGGGRTLTANATAPITLSGNLILAENNQSRTLTMNIASGSQVLVSGRVQNGSGSGADGLTKIGAGELVLGNNNNSFSGLMTLGGGVLTVGSDSALGVGNFSWSGANSVLQSDGSPRTLSNAVAISNNVVFGGSSSLTMAGQISQSGSRIVTIDNPATVTLSGNLILAENNQTRTLTLNVTSGSQALVSGVVQNGAGSGADGVTKTGAGTLTLSANNSFSGPVTLNQGTLVVGSNSALGSGSLSIAGLGGTIRTDGSPRSLANPTILNANLVIGGTANVSFSGNWTQASGNRTVTVSNSGVTSLTGSTLVLGPSNAQSTLTFEVLPGATLAVQSALQNGSGSGPDRLTKTGAGMLILSGNNSFTGQILLSGGITQVSSNTALAASLPVHLGGGTLRVETPTVQTGILQLNSASTLNFGSLAGGVSFANSSLVPWSLSATLSISGYVPGLHSLRFGTSSTGISLAQLSRLRFVDQGNVPGQVDALGFVTPVPEPRLFHLLVFVMGVVWLRGCYRRRRFEFRGAGRLGQRG